VNHIFYNPLKRAAQEEVVRVLRTLDRSNDIGLWRRTFWSVTWKGRSIGITDVMSSINRGTLSKTALGGEWP
jgi:hypothetical protein